MPEIDAGRHMDALKTELKSLAGSGTDPKLTQPIEDMLTALDYADETLLESSFHSLLSGMADVARDFIVNELKQVNATKEGIARGWKEHVDGRPCEDFDELRNVIESLIDDRIANMSRLRDKLVKPLKVRACIVDNAPQLEEGIRDLRQFRHELLRNWPSSSRQPSALDHAAIAEARAAIASGSKGLRKDQLKWGRDSLQKGN